MTLATTSRPSGRHWNELRAVSLETDVSLHAEGSVLIRFGHTQVLCTATVEEKIPPFVRSLPSAERHGWVHAEYGMLPRSTQERMRRESMQGKASGRTMEIQRLIARSLRAALDLKALGERTLIIDCDVIQADGGTRTAAITGGFVALALAIDALMKAGKLEHSPIKHSVAAVSVGVLGEEVVLDLDYAEDSTAETDLNLVMTDSGGFIEVQGTAEGQPYTYDQLQQMLAIGQQGIKQLIDLQQQTLQLG